MGLHHDPENSTSFRQPNLAEQEFAWASEVLRLNEDTASTPDKRSQLLAAIEKENYQLSSRELHAINVFLKRTDSLENVADTPSPFAMDHADALREKTEVFAQQFFSLDPETRQKEFDSLLSQATIDSRITQRLRQLEPALKLNLDELLPEEPAQRQLVEAIAELFVTPKRERGSCRHQAVLSLMSDSNRVEIIHAAKNLKVTYPDFVSLELEFIDEIANYEERQKKTKRNLKRLNSRLSKRPREKLLNGTGQPEVSRLAYVAITICALCGFIAGIARQHDSSKTRTSSYRPKVVPYSKPRLLPPSPEEQFRQMVEKLERSYDEEQREKNKNGIGKYLKPTEEIKISLAIQYIAASDEIVAMKNQIRKDQLECIDEGVYPDFALERYAIAFKAFEEVLPSIPKKVLCINCMDYFSRGCLGHAIGLRKTSDDLAERERVVRRGIEAANKLLKPQPEKYPHLQTVAGLLWHLLAELQIQRNDNKEALSSLKSAISHQQIAAKEESSQPIHKSRLDGHLKSVCELLLNTNRPFEALAVVMVRWQLFPGNIRRLGEIRQTVASAKELIDKNEMSGSHRKFNSAEVIRKIEESKDKLIPIIGTAVMSDFEKGPEWKPVLNTLLTNQ